MVPQAWLVLSVFIVSIIFAFAMTIASPYFRALMYDSSNIQAAFHILLIIVLAILMVYSTECSVNRDMVSCSAFAWVLAAIAVIALIVQIGYGLYTHFMLKRNAERAA